MYEVVRTSVIFVQLVVTTAINCVLLFSWDDRHCSMNVLVTAVLTEGPVIAVLEVTKCVRVGVTAVLRLL